MTLDNAAVDALILRVAGGDMGALESLYNGLSRSVYAFAMTIVKNHALAEDVMQDTFVRLYGAAGSFRAGGMGRAWIMRIARNLALNALTRGQQSAEEAAEERPAKESTEEAAISSVMLERAMQKLSDDERQIVTLHAVSGLKLHEIAAALELPLGTVKWKHSKALGVLRRELEGEA